MEVPEVRSGEARIVAHDGNVQIVVPAGKRAEIEWPVATPGAYKLVLENGAKAFVRVVYDLIGAITQEIFVGDNAECTMIEYGMGATVTETVHCGKESKMQHTVITLPTAQANIARTYFLEKPYASVVDHELVWAKKQGVHEQKVHVFHLAPQTSSQVKVKEIIQDIAKSKMHGLVRVEKDAINISSFLEAHALLLDKSAIAQIIPALEIETSEVVRAGHATTVSPLDEEQLFYLTARGLDDREAKKMLVRGFAQDALMLLPEAEQEKILQLCEE